MSSARAYDYILELNDASLFEVGNTVFSNSVLAEIIYKQDNNLKVKVANTFYQFHVSDNIYSNTSIMNIINSNVIYDNANAQVILGNSYIIDGVQNTFSLPDSADYKAEIQVYMDNVWIDPNEYIWPSSTLAETGIDFIKVDSNVSSLYIELIRGNPDKGSFLSSNVLYEVTTANSEIKGVHFSPYIRELNRFQQNPVITLYDIYYPGEWYPPNENDNPTNGFAWPYEFPLRYAQTVGEIDCEYIQHLGKQYKAFPMESSEISIASSGSISEITMKISNYDGFIARLIENTKLVGNCYTNAVSAVVNNELVHNIDPRTVVGNPLYDSLLANSKGSNTSLTYEDSVVLNGDWKSFKTDSRDLLGAVVVIKTIFANFLNYWPEYSKVTTVNSNVITTQTTGVYRIGDKVQANSSNQAHTILSIYDGNIYLDTFTGNVGDALLILNEYPDEQSYVKEEFQILRMTELTETTVDFTLTSWVNSFKRRIPKDLYSKDYCPHVYKGKYCQYPENGSDPIPNSSPVVMANGYFTQNNTGTIDPNMDICSKTHQACKLRNNLQHFGGFYRLKTD